MTYKARAAVCSDIRTKHSTQSDHHAEYFNVKPGGPVQVAVRSKACVCSHSPAEIVGSNPTEEWMFVCREYCVLSGRGLCDELITRPEESYRLWCVVVCDLETSRMRRSWPVLGCSATHKKKNLVVREETARIWKVNPRRIWVFQDVTLCHWASNSQHFKGF